jgi:hypothetical protein
MEFADDDPQNPSKTSRANAAPTLNFFIAHPRLVIFFFFYCGRLSDSLPPAPLALMSAFAAFYSWFSWRSSCFQPKKSPHPQDLR